MFQMLRCVLAKFRQYSEEGDAISRRGIEFSAWALCFGPLTTDCPFYDFFFCGGLSNHVVKIIKKTIQIRKSSFRSNQIGNLYQTKSP